MGTKIARILKSEMTTSVFYIALGLCLTAAPVQTVNLICKVIFGLVLIGSGGYQLYTFLKGKEDATIIDMFSGVIVLVFGVFLFFNPQIVVRLLPMLIGALILVDSIWLFRTGFQLKNQENNLWTAYVAGAAVGIILAAIIILNPFAKVRTTILFSGIVLLLNGVADVVFFMLRKKHLDPSLEKNKDSGENTQDDNDMYDAYDPSLTAGSELHHHFGDPVEEERHFGNPPDLSGQSAGNTAEGKAEASAWVSEETAADAGVTERPASSENNPSQQPAGAYAQEEARRQEPPHESAREDGFSRKDESEWKF